MTLFLCRRKDYFNRKYVMKMTSQKFSIFKPLP